MNVRQDTNVVGKISAQLSDKTYEHLNTEERIKKIFHLYHGTGKRSKKKKRGKKH